MQAIDEALGNNRERPLYIGSVKAVVGHTEECAGLAGMWWVPILLLLTHIPLGVLKALLCFANNAIPPQPRTGPLNAAIDSMTCRAIVPGSITAFLPQGLPRLCGVSSFGLSGTLAHIILQEPQLVPLQISHTGRHVFILSARNSVDYLIGARRYLDSFDAQHLRGDAFEAACRTTQVGRDHFSVRRAWVLTGWRALLEALHQALAQPPPRPLALHYRPKFGIWFGLPLSGRSRLE